MRPGYFYLHYSIDGGATWRKCGPMLWTSLRKRQSRIHRVNTGALSAPSFAVAK